MSLHIDKSEKEKEAYFFQECLKNPKKVMQFVFRNYTSLKPETLAPYDV